MDQAERETIYLSILRSELNRHIHWAIDRLSRPIIVEVLQTLIKEVENGSS